MTPNLFLATQTLFSPHKWFKHHPKGERPTRKTEHWNLPVAGIYEYIPGRGWYLVATDKPSPVDEKGPVVDDVFGPNEASPVDLTKETIRMTPPVQAKYSKVLKRYLLAPDYEIRKKNGRVQNSRGKWYTAGFFRLDDGIAWVECWDEEGLFIPGPYKLWCIDQHTGQFRHMLKGDDPGYIHSRATSRQNSFEADTAPASTTTRRTSQDSRSTQWRGSGPGSTRDGLSIPSTRANSIRAFTPSKPSSQANSRRNSPKRSPALHLEEAKAKLKVMAAEQAAAALAAAGDTKASRASVEDEELRGRPLERRR